MREILFQGKRLDNGEWVEGLLFKYKGKFCIALYSLEGDDYGLYPTCYAEVDPSTIGQYTGLCDKNGERIFEGDILHFWSDYREAYTGKCVVKYGDFNCNCCEGVYGWYLENGDIRYLSNEEHPVYEVCGNIHDNPELLEGEG